MGELWRSFQNYEGKMVQFIQYQLIIMKHTCLYDRLNGSCEHQVYCGHVEMS